MKTSRLAGLLLVFGMLALFVLRVFWIGSHLSSLKPVSRAEAAPDFTLPLLRGGEFHLAPTQSGGQVTLIDFWATWCGPCRQELPHVERLYRRYQSQGVRMVAVDVESMQSKNAADRIATQLGLTLPIALGGELASQDYKVDSLPTLMVIDRSGRVGKVLLGMHDEEEIAAVLDENLAEK